MEPLIKGAACALDYYDEDELERYAEEQRRSKEIRRQQTKG